MLGASITAGNSNPQIDTYSGKGNKGLSLTPVLDKLIYVLTLNRFELKH